MNRVGIYVSYAYDYASGVTSVPTYLSQYINWSYAGYTGAALLTVTTSYLVYTGAITPIPTI
jgi:hypothetical protein